jgi:hypothetical protein
MIVINTARHHAQTTFRFQNATTFSRTHKKSFPPRWETAQGRNWETVETAHCGEMRVVIGGVGFVWVLTGRG